jgi:nitrite reductase/ring-hydroxylating ferredoxin subunit
VREGDKVFAYVNRCPHAGHPLNIGPNDFLTADCTHIVCNSHGATFEIASGLCIAGPCVGAGLEKIPIRLESGLVVIDGDVDELSRRYA